MQAELTIGGFDVFAYDTSLVRGKAIENQTHGFSSTMHELAQQRDKQLAVQSTHIGAEPKFSARTYRRGGRDRLTLPRSIYDWRLAAQSPRLSVNRIGAKARFIPKQNLRAVALRLTG